MSPCAQESIEEAVTVLAAYRTRNQASVDPGLCRGDDNVERQPQGIHTWAWPSCGGGKGGGEYVSRGREGRRRAGRRKDESAQASRGSQDCEEVCTHYVTDHSLRPDITPCICFRQGPTVCGVDSGEGALCTVRSERRRCNMRYDTITTCPARVSRQRKGKGVVW